MLAAEPSRSANAQSVRWPIPRATLAARPEVLALHAQWAISPGAHAFGDSDSLAAAQFWEDCPVMALPGRSYQELVDEILARIPVHEPEWTNFYQSDPGVTLLELFAFLADNLLRVDAQQGLARPDGTSKTLDEVRKRLEGRLEHLSVQTKRVQCALRRLNAIQPEEPDSEEQSRAAD